jgi:hypothetical protein
MVYCKVNLSVHYYGTIFWNDCKSFNGPKNRNIFKYLAQNLGIDKKSNRFSPGKRRERKANTRRWYRPFDASFGGGTF